MLIILWFNALMMLGGASPHLPSPPAYRPAGVGGEGGGVGSQGHGRRISASVLISGS